MFLCVYLCIINYWLEVWVFIIVMECFVICGEMKNGVDDEIIICFIFAVISDLFCECYGIVCRIC